MNVHGQIGKYGYISEGVQCYIHVNQVQKSVPLYRYWKPNVNDHFYTTKSAEIGTTTPGQTGRHGYKSEGIAGYCFPENVSNTVPLYRYWNGRVSDHFYTTSADEIGTITAGKVGKHGYVSEGIVCYVLPQ